jgi:hypothetical protein
MYVFEVFVMNQMAMPAQAYFYTFYSLPLIYVSVSMICYFFKYGSVIQFEITSVIPSTLVFSLRIALAIQGLLGFHLNFRIFYFCEGCH